MRRHSAAGSKGSKAKTTLRYIRSDSLCQTDQLDLSKRSNEVRSLEDLSGRPGTGGVRPSDNLSLVPCTRRYRRTREVGEQRPASGDEALTR